MRYSRTSIFGGIAAAATAVAGITIAPPVVHTLAVLVAAVGIALLGFFSLDAPRSVRVRPLHIAAVLAAPIAVWLAASASVSSAADRSQWAYPTVPPPTTNTPTTKAPPQ